MTPFVACFFLELRGMRMRRSMARKLPITTAGCAPQLAQNLLPYLILGECVPTTWPQVQTHFHVLLLFMDDTQGSGALGNGQEATDLPSVTCSIPCGTLPELGRWKCGTPKAERPPEFNGNGVLGFRDVLGFLGRQCLALHN